jgi:hypothetical protein
MCKIFNVRNLEKSDIGFVRISAYPHKNGPRSVRLKYEYSVIMEKLLECEFSSFILACRTESSNLLNEGDSQSGAHNFPFLWRMFTPKSFQRIMRFVFEAFFHNIREHIQELEIQSVNGRVLKCCVWWRIKFYPLIEMPESITIAVRPLTISYNPFINKFQKTF